ncbi:hypothetical protein D3C72_356090 [compost metagenome]
MIRFGFFYLNGRLTVYDVTLECVHGRLVYVAALSEDPRIRFQAVRQENAVEQLKAYMAELAQPSHRAAVTWMPGSAPAHHAS